MKNPKSKNILKVVNNFKKIIEKYPYGELAMSESEVNHHHECGTVHCHGGWYAVATCDLDESLGYLDGAIKMSQDLGFEWSHLLVKWAGRNPGLWGNAYGLCMFGDSVAFFHPEKRPKGAGDLQHIVDHWEEVYERVKKMEK